MSLYSILNTSASGMAAQSSRLSAVSDNVANSSTTGYKDAETNFSTLVIGDNTTSYESGSVNVESRRMVSTQGTLVATNSPTDLGIQGDGFFLVQAPDNSIVLTRAGNFIENAQNQLTNAAGFTLMGYSLTNGSTNAVSNGTSGLVPITISLNQLSAVPTTSGTFSANLPPTDAIVAAANLPSANTATSSYSEKSSIVVYGDLGDTVTLDLYSTKTGPNTWEVDAFNKANASASGGFPYSAAPLATQTLTFDPTTGKLTSSSAKSISVNVPGGLPTTIDLSGMSQLATGYTVTASSVNGNAVSKPQGFKISNDGTVEIAYANGITQPTYRIPLATVASPDNLQSLSGNVYTTNSKSGSPLIGYAQQPGFGSIDAGTLEQSTVDIAKQLTNMIDAQQSYTANSKVFQTGSDLLQVLVNIKQS